jgi:hypothetical protein
MKKTHCRLVVLLALVLAVPSFSAGQVPPFPCFVLEREVAIGSYTARLWVPSDPETNWEHGPGVLTLDRAGAERTTVDWVFAIDPLSGTDVTGEGNPDLVFECYSGGAHCCFSTFVYDLGAEAREIQVTRDSNCSGYFQDLDRDGVPEFLTCDDTFAYRYCPYAGSPAVEVVLRYDGDGRYVPASSEFPGFYDQAIARHTALAEAAARGEGEDWDWDGTAKCAVLPLVLDYLYSGRTMEAWAALDRYYLYPDKATFRAEILAALKGSPLFAWPGNEIVKREGAVPGALP